jgi:hypothetical protein
MTGGEFRRLVRDGIECLDPLYRRTGPGRLSPDQCRALQGLYDAGWSRQRLARFYRVPLRTVSKVLQNRRSEAG